MTSKKLAAKKAAVKKVAAKVVRKRMPEPRPAIEDLLESELRPVAEDETVPSSTDHAFINLPALRREAEPTVAEFYAKGQPERAVRLLFDYIDAVHAARNQR